MQPTPGQEIIGRVVTGALLGWLVGRPKLGAGLGAAYGVYRVSQRGQGAPAAQAKAARLLSVVHER